jgi:hypothetical protein
MPDIASLALLGLTSYEAQAYLALLGRPRLTPPEVAALAKIPRQRVYDVLESLAAKGLCAVRGDSPKSYAALDPEAGLEMLGQERLSALKQERERTRAAVSALSRELAPVFAAGMTQNDPLAYVEVLTGTARIAHRAQALAEAARTRVNSCVRRPMILSREQNAAFMEVPLARGLTYRALYEEAALDDALLRDFIDDLSPRGLIVRLVRELPLKMQAFDDLVVLVSMQDPTAGEPGFTAVLIRNRGMVAMMNLAFEHLWESARPYAG